MARTAKDAEHRAKLREAARQLMHTPEGRVLLRWLLDISRVLSADYSEASGALYFMQGQRSVGLALLRLVTDVDAAHLAALIDKEDTHD